MRFMTKLSSPGLYWEEEGIETSAKCKEIYATYSEGMTFGVFAV